MGKPALLIVVLVAATFCAACGGGSDNDGAQAQQATTAPEQEPQTEPPPPAPEPEPPPAEPAEPEVTAGQENARRSAEQYLETSPFSRKGLIQQLSSDAGEGYSKAEAIYAVNHIDVDWNEQAAKAAKNYLDISPFSRQGLIEQLESDARRRLHPRPGRVRRQRGWTLGPAKHLPRRREHRTAPIQARRSRFVGS